jgi:hypothetical protein
VQHEQRIYDLFRLRTLLTALLMMRCRTGTAQSSGAFRLKACGGPGSAVHRSADKFTQSAQA